MVKTMDTSGQKGLQDSVSSLQFVSMRRRWITSFVLASTLLGTSVLQAASRAEDFLHEGVAAFRKSDYPAARVAFKESLKAEHSNPAALYNLGLVEYRAGNEGLGIGLWREASTLDPAYSPATSALQWATNRLPRASLVRDVGLWEEFRTLFLQPIPLDRYILLSALLTFLTGWVTLKYFGDRRRALLDEKPLPPLPTIPATMGGLLVIALSLSAAKAYDQSIPRGTILLEKVAVQTTPDQESAALFDLFEGFEVIVRQSSGDWLLVTQPGGLTGWVPKATVFISSGERTEP